MAKMVTREAYGKAFVELAKENKRILVLDVDLPGFIKTDEVKKVVPEQRFDFGIAEGNMMVVATGMVTSGSIVFASIFTMFVAGRAFEQVRNSICYPYLNAKMCATYAGLTIGEGGASHQNVEDVALMRSIPGMVVVSPTDGVKTKTAIRAVAEYDGLCYVRLDRMAVEDVYTEDTPNSRIGKGNVIRKGNSVTLIVTGTIVEAAMKAADILKENGMDVTVIGIHTIKPIDEELIVGLIKDHDLFVTYEEYSVTGGLSSAAAEVLSQETPEKLAMAGVKDTFGESGTPTTLLEKYGLTVNDIVKAVEDNK